MYEEMTSLERCQATIRLEPHDRVPVDLHNFMMTVVDEKLSPQALSGWAVTGRGTVGVVEEIRARHAHCRERNCGARGGLWLRGKLSAWQCAGD